MTVVDGGPTGALIGPIAADVPDAKVDTVVAEGLREWLTFEEKRALAVASERAALASAGTAIDWQSHDGSAEMTASGSAEAMGDIYRSLRGEICRDVRQSVSKDGKAHAETVPLCREPDDGPALWVARAD